MKRGKAAPPSLSARKGHMPSPPPRRAAGLSSEENYPPWRPRTHNPQSLRQLADAQERELEIFASARRLAALENTPLEELYRQICLLGGASDSEVLPPEAAAYARSMRDRELAPRRDVDAEGNPLWISLTLRERRDDGLIEVRGVLPGEAESAAPRTFIHDSREKGRERAGLFGALIAFLSRLAGAKEKTPPEKGNGRRKAAKPELEALGGFVKMLLLGAVLALVWHFFVKG